MTQTAALSADAATHLGDRGAPVRIGTRGSALALVQARLIATALHEAGVPAEIVVIETAGDRRAPEAAWGEGAFVRAIQEALLDRRVDLAIHSAKDVPTETHPGLVIGAYVKRADARDCLVTRPDQPISTLEDLPLGARVGTDSPRRTGFLLAQRPDLTVAPLHGNVDTRLRKLDEGQADALVLAVAGLERLGRSDRVGPILEPQIVPPAPGQGALAVELRAGDAELLGLIARIDHAPTRIAVEAERAVLFLSGGGCRSPIGAFGEVHDGELTLTAGYASVDGRVAGIHQVRGATADAASLARRLVDQLESTVGVRGAGRARPRVLVTRPAGQAGEMIDALEALGMDGVEVPALEIEPADDALTSLGPQATAFDWVVVTSANGAVELSRSFDPARSTLMAGARWAAVGAATADALRSHGISEVWTPSTADGTSLADELPIGAGSWVLLARTPIADADARGSPRATGRHGHRSRRLPDRDRASDLAGGAPFRIRTTRLHRRDHVPERIRCARPAGAGTARISRSAAWTCRRRASDRGPHMRRDGSASAKSSSRPTGRSRASRRSRQPRLDCNEEVCRHDPRSRGDAAHGGLDRAAGGAASQWAAAAAAPHSGPAGAGSRDAAAPRRCSSRRCSCGRGTACASRFPRWRDTRAFPSTRP